jgi:hypothetical protein
MQAESIIHFLLWDMQGKNGFAALKKAPGPATREFRQATNRGAPASGNALHAVAAMQRALQKRPLA